MSLNEELKSHWSKIDAGLAKLAELRKTLFADAPDLPDPTEEIKNLKNGLYTIAVCGTVKAGKSTLLNSLFFGNSVLPADATPTTAKLTFIRYGKGKPKFEVEFYSKEEWNCLKSTYSAEILNELIMRVEACVKRGASINDWICSPRLENYCGGGDDFIDELLKFIADPLKVQVEVSPDSNSPSEYGIYTPFVKSVTITIDNPAIKNLQIVDTPGLNDSNEINSDQTLKWIRQAHAVVFVLETKGVTKEDVDFFRYFTAAEAETRLFVQNKIDTEPVRYRNAIQTIRQYGKDEKYRAMGLFGENEIICSYSSLLILSQKKAAGGFTLSKSEETVRRKLRVDFDGDPDHLEAKLAERLFQREGAVRLRTAKGRIIDVYQSAIANCEAEIAVCKRQLPDCDKTESQLKTERIKYKDYSRKIKQLGADAEQEFNDFINKCNEAIDKALKGARKSILSTIRKAAGMCGATDNAAKATIPCVLMELKDNAFENVSDVASMKRDEFRPKLKEIKKRLEVGAKDAGIMDDVVVRVVRLDISERMDAAIDSLEIKGEELYDILPGKFWKFFGRHDTEELVNIIMKEVNPVVDDCVKGCGKSLKELFEQTGKAELGVLLSGFTKYCDERDKELSEAEAKLSESLDRKKKLQDRISQLMQHRREIEDAAREMKHFIDSDV